MTAPLRPRRRHGVSRQVFALVTVVLAALFSTVAPLLPIEAQTRSDAVPIVEINGRGWGHGRGMGQYGALGYAEQGWSADRILDHFYGATTAGPAPTPGVVDAGAVRVDLRFMRGNDTTVGLSAGTIVLLGTDGAELDRIPAGVVRLRRSGNGYSVETGPSCGGPWTARSTIEGREAVDLVADSTSAGTSGLLHACGSTFRTWYRGRLRATTDGGSARTVNIVTIDQYLAGVVPNEVPASWPEATLEAQAVAARSYALAGDRRQLPYADTCDTARCQVYDGAFTDRGGRLRPTTHPRTDAAVAASSGVVRLTSGGSVARTEFSSSTGGYTAGGDFPAVIDEGDSVEANPNHTWSVTFQTSAIEAHYGRGRLQSIEVVERNGLGADGGRVEQMELRFERGTVTETGNGFRLAFGLKSDWFTVRFDDGANLRNTHEGSYIDAMYRLLVGRAATDGEIEQWFDAVGTGDRRSLTNELVKSDHFAGELVDDLYTTALGRSSDGGGRAYWVGQMAAGVVFEDISAWFYGSAEYFRRQGGTDAAFITALYRDVLGREPDPNGAEYWMGRRGAGVPRGEVAIHFFGSLESRRSRVVALHQRIMGAAPSDEVRNALARRLGSGDDLAVAAEIAASEEAWAAAG